MAGPGRKTSWTKALEKKAWAYANGKWKDVEHAFPSIVGLCSILKVARSTVYLWAEHEDKQFDQILEHINSEQELIVMNLSIKNEYNATISKLVLAKHGYHDKSEVEQTNIHVKKRILTEEEAEAINKALENDF